MDVITFFQDEGRAIRAPRRSVSFLREKNDRQPRVAAVAAPREPLAQASFPFIFVIFATACVALSPLAQDRLGFYRLGRLGLPGDDRAEFAMRQLSIPEPDASLLAEASAAEVPASIQAVTWSEYKVRAGDSVGAIVARFGLRNVSTILSSNSIENVRRIKTGQTLRVPSMDGVAYTVARGDSLGKIANRYGVSMTAILDANDLASETLAVGQRLFVPGATLSSYELRRAMGELFIYPIKGRLTSRFGYRSDPFTGARTFHTGIDLAAPTGTSIKAVLDGKVATTGFSTVFGNYVIITHDNGYQSLYGHMSVVGVKRGQYVSQGAIIGKVGSTGYSTGPHVHLSMYKNGKMVDPLSLLK